MLSSLLLRLRCLRTDQLTTDRALFAWFCFLFLCALFGFGCLFCCFFLFCTVTAMDCGPILRVVAVAVFFLFVLA